MLLDGLEGGLRELAGVPGGEVVDGFDHHLRVAGVRELTPSIAQCRVEGPPRRWLHRAPRQAEQRARLLERLARVVHRIDRIGLDLVAQLGDRELELLTPTAPDRLGLRLPRSSWWTWFSLSLSSPIALPRCQAGNRWRDARARSGATLMRYADPSHPPRRRPGHGRLPVSANRRRGARADDELRAVNVVTDEGETVRFALNRVNRPLPVRRTRPAPGCCSPAEPLLQRPAAAAARHTE